MIWPGFDDAEAWAARVGALTVITSFDAGVRIVDDAGTVLAAPPLGEPSFDEVPILVDGDHAFVVAVDGVLHAIDAGGST